MRFVLLAAVTIHIALTAQLALQSRAARPVRYVHTGVVQASYASRTMRWGGIALLGFIVFHLMDLSWGVHPHFVRGAVYHNVVVGFRRWPITAVYVAAMGALAMHLYHGTWSVFQTLGVNQARWDRAIHRGALTLALVVSVGFITVPMAVLVHLVK
jgi:succinate dehydrogenase / fumarate reductase cytochrome b subunit